MVLEWVNLEFTLHQSGRGTHGLLNPRLEEKCPARGHFTEYEKSQLIY